MRFEDIGLGVGGHLAIPRDASARVQEKNAYRVLDLVRNLGHAKFNLEVRRAR